MRTASLLSWLVRMLRVFLQYWLIVIAWIVVIFSASSDRASFQRSSRILGPLFRWLFPEWSEETVYAAVTFLRKCAHVTEYAVLAMLLWRALRHVPGAPASPATELAATPPPVRETRRWSWRVATIAFGLVVLYALSDELHQVIVPSRQGSVVDVFLDCFGGLLGLVFVWTVGWVRGRW